MSELTTNTQDNDSVVQSRLSDILTELTAQVNLAPHYPESGQSFQEEMEQIREYIEDANEFSIAYECIVANLEQVPFTLSGRGAVKLLEVALLMGYKTERLVDKAFDMRN